MAKKNAHFEALGSYENWRAPWETDAGDDAEIDKAKLKRLIYNVKADYAKARDSHDETKEALEAAEADLETARAEAADANGAEAQKKIDKLTKKVADLESERDKLVSEKEAADLREEVLGDFARENPRAAKYVKGETREELEESLAAVKEDFGITDEPDEKDEDEDEPDKGTVRTRPRRLSNPLDETAGKGVDTEVDFDKVADDVLGRGVFV